MDVRFRPLRWDGPSTPAAQRRSRWTFKASWTSTLDLLDRELTFLGARDVVVEADFLERDIRLDGWPRANARQPVHPGVRVAFDSRHGPLVYATDSCEFWQHNARSIGLGLEALRAVDRYGITRRGEQYTGWRQIGAAPATELDLFTSPESAWHHLLEAAGYGVRPDLPLSSTPTYEVQRVVRLAQRETHPDRGGNADRFRIVTAAAAMVEDGNR